MGRPGDRSGDIDALGLALSRARSRPGLLAATVLTVLLATVFVTAAALTSAAAGRGSVEAALAGSDPAERQVVVRADLAEASSLEAADRAVQDVVASTFGPVPASVTRRVVSSSYRLPGRTDGLPRLGVVATYEDLDQHARLVAGRWPETAGEGRLEVVVHRAVADELGLGVGDRLEGSNQLDGAPLVARVTGVVLPTGTAGGYWAGDDLGSTGRDTGGSFVTYGPFFTAPGAEESVADAEVVWRADPALTTLEPAAVEPLRRAAVSLTEEGAAELAPDIPGAVVESGLDDVLSGVDTPVQVARAAVGLPLALVGLLALSALVLLARLLQEDRAAGAALQVSRGFSAPQLWRQNAVEALTATIPAALLAPPLAWGAVKLVSLLADAPRVSSAVTLEPGAWAWSTLCAVVVTVVLLRRGAARGGGGRARRVWERLGLDLVALPLAAVAVVRLIGSRADGAALDSLRDPFLVLAVPLALLALALLVGRLVRLVLLAGAGVAASSRGVVTSVASWQLARRAEEHRALLVAVVLAGSVAAFAAAYLGSTGASRDAQAGLAVGADLRVVGLPGQAAGDRVVTSIEEAGGTAMLVTRERTSVGSASVDVLAVDPAVAAEVLTPPPDDDWPSLLAPVVAQDGGRRAPLVGVVDPAVLAEAGGAGTIRARVAGTDVALEPGAEVDDVPGVGPEADAVVGSTAPAVPDTGTGVVVDRAELGARVPGLDADAETEVWAAVDRTDVAAVHDGLEGLEGVEGVEGLRVEDRWSAAEAQREGPVSSGSRVGLLVGLTAAGVFGLIGFVAAAGAGLRQRRTEVASLRATGLSRRQVGLSLLGERAALLSVATVVGVVVGVATAAVLLPRLVLTDAGELPAPPLSLLVPWPVLVSVVAGMLVLSIAVLAAMVAGVVNRPVGDELRRGEDT